MKYLATAVLVGGSMLVGPALAQDKTAPPAADSQTNQMKTPPTGTAMPAGDAMGGMTMADTATAKIKFVATKPAEVTSSKLVGKNLYNKKEENIGQIEDIVIDNGKTVSGVVVSVGGFLGMGERYVLVDPSSIFLHKTDDALKAMVDADKDTLKNAPEFKYGKKNS